MVGKASIVIKFLFVKFCIAISFMVFGESSTCHKVEMWQNPLSFGASLRILMKYKGFPSPQSQC